MNLSKGAAVEFVANDTEYTIPTGTRGRIIAMSVAQEIRRVGKPEEVCTVSFDGIEELFGVRKDCLKPVYDGETKIHWAAMSNLWLPEEYRSK